MAKNRHNSAHSQKSKKHKKLPTNNGCFGNPHYEFEQKWGPYRNWLYADRSVHTFEHRTDIFAQMGRICNKVLENGGPTKIIFDPYTLYYDFHPQLVGALGGDTDKYVKCLTICYYYLMKDIDKLDIPYYLQRFGIKEEEYEAMLAVATDFSYKVA